MVTYISMFAVLLFLGFSILYKAEFLEDNTCFFNKENTAAMRGFWSIVIILVHVPEFYQNQIQDMIGSFAYIGVTFFFMTSAYGLKYGISHNSDSLNIFWRRRFPKLLIPLCLVSIIAIVVNLICGKDLNLVELFDFCEWVKWLLVCYLVFWIIYKNNKIVHKDLVISALLVAFSLLMYFIKDYYWTTTWAPEIYGFIWGLLLANFKNEFKKKALDNWFVKSIALFILSVGIGLIYLRFKPVYFIGEYLIKIVLGFSILFFILQLTARIKIDNHLNQFLGGISYVVFLIHGEIMTLLGFYFPELESGIYIVLTIVITITVSTIVNMISNRLTKQIKRKLGV